VRRLPAGRDGLLVEVGSVGQALTLYAEARSADLRVTDVVPAARTVLFDGVADLPALHGWLDSVELSRRPAGRTARVVEVPTVYDGADLDDVARLWRMTAAEVVATHTSTGFVVAFCGFAPGFAYCTGLPPELSVPRLESPRARVPAGSVGLAGEFTGVYPTASPGGWRLVGRTSLALWDPRSEEPARLQPGCRVRFVAVEE
jgi:KipI family sensor histidine kinase inhibitor